jgi:hypothetical protein
MSRTNIYGLAIAAGVAATTAVPAQGPSPDADELQKARCFGDKMPVPDYNMVSRYRKSNATEGNLIYQHSYTAHAGLPSSFKMQHRNITLTTLELDGGRQVHLYEGKGDLTASFGPDAATILHAHFAIGRDGATKSVLLLRQNGQDVKPQDLTPAAAQAIRQMSEAAVDCKIIFKPVDLNPNPK